MQKHAYILTPLRRLINLSPLDAAFLGGIDLREGCAFVEEVALDVVEEKVLGVGIRQIQTVMINYLRLLLQPTAPARLADFGCEPLP